MIEFKIIADGNCYLIEAVTGDGTHSIIQRCDDELTANEQCLALSMRARVIDQRLRAAAASKTRALRRMAPQDRPESRSPWGCRRRTG